MKPSQKQLDFAQAIVEELGIDPPFGGDSREYSEWISENKSEFYKERNRSRYATGRCFSMSHQYSLAEHEYDRLTKNPEAL